MVSPGVPRCYGASFLLHLHPTRLNSILQRVCFTEKSRRSCSPGAEVTCGIAGQDAPLRPYRRGVPGVHQLHGFLCWALEIICAITSAVSIQQAGEGCEGFTNRNPAASISCTAEAIKKKKNQLLHTVGSLTAGEKMKSILKWPSIRSGFHPQPPFPPDALASEQSVLQHYEGAAMG